MLTRPLTQPLTGPLARGVGEGGINVGPFSVTGAYTAVIGDSVDAYGANSWFEETCRLSLQRMRRYVNAGISGNNTTQMLARIGTDITSLSPKPHVCVIGGCTNDISQGFTTTVTRQNYADMVSALVAAGIKPVVRNTPPRDNAGTGAFNTVALARAATIDHNTWLAGWAAGQGIPVIDIYTPLADSGTPGGYLAGLTTDSIHPNALGCYTASKYAAARLPGFINTAARPYLTSQTTDPLNIVPNGAFLLDTNADGIADSFTTPSATLPAIVASTFADGVGKQQNFTTTNGTLGYLHAVTTPSNPSGHVFEAALNMRADVGKNLTVRVTCINSGFTSLGSFDVIANWVVQGTEEQTAFVRFIAPANTFYVQLDLIGNASGATGQISASRYTIRDRTANP